MPSVRIDGNFNVSQSVGKTTNNRLEIFGGVAEGRYYINDQFLFFGADLNNNILSVLPENTSVSKVFLKFYAYKPGIFANPHVWSMSTLSTSINFRAEYSGGTRYPIDVAVKSGWNTVELSELAIQALKKKNSILIFLPDTGKYFQQDSSFRYAMNYSDVLVIGGASDVNKAYIEVEYAFNPPESSKSLAPNKETINPRKPIRFSWDNKYTQTKFELQYRVGTGAWKSETESTSNKFYVMPYNTITASEGVLEWRVRTAGESGVYSDWETASFELAVEAMQDPRIVTPSGDYIESSRPIRFEWQFVANAFEEQVSYELEYTLDKTLPKTTTVKGTTSDTFYVLEHDYNASTVGKWRIRVTNNYEEVSGWTDWAEFNIMGAPPIPQILEVSNTNIPTMKWNSKEQEVFEVLIYDSEDVEVYNSKRIIGVEVREFTPNITLTNGKYKFVLRVYNKYNVASPQAEYTIVINPEAIEPPTISVHEDDYCVLIKSNVLDARVYRNEYHIGDLVNGEFYDYTGANNKLYNYKVRQVVNGVYSDSQSLSAKVNFTYDTLALLKKPNEYIKLDKSLNDLPEQQVNRTYDAAQHRLDGRKYELTEFSGLVRETIAIQYFVWFAEEVQKLLDANEEMIYRNTRGMVFIGTSLGLGYNQIIFGDDASFVMSKSRDEYD